MAKQEIRTDKAPQPVRPYSQGIKAGPFVFVSGQIPRDPITGETAGSTIEAQTHRTLQNVQAVLAAAGAGMEHVVKATVHLTDLSLAARFDAVYAEYFPEPRPVRTTVGSRLGADFLVEVDVIAYLG